MAASQSAAELSLAVDGSCTGEEFVMRASGADGISLAHQGKVLNKNCKKA